MRKYYVIFTLLMILVVTSACSDDEETSEEPAETDKIKRMTNLPRMKMKKLKRNLNTLIH